MDLVNILTHNRSPDLIPTCLYRYLQSYLGSCIFPVLKQNLSAQIFSQRGRK